MKEFIKQNRLLIVFTLFLTFLSHITFLINSNDVLTDTEMYIIWPKEEISFFENNSRFAVYLAKKILSTYYYAPSMYILYAIITYSICALSLNYILINSINKKSKSCSILYYLLNALWVTSPVMVFQFYFYYQAFEICLGILAGIWGAYYTWKMCTEEMKIRYLIIAIPTSVWCFATYQSLIPMYIAFIAVLFYLRLLNKSEEQNTIKISIKLIIAFVIQMVIYLICAKLWITLRYPGESSATLTSTYLGWKSFSFKECIKLILLDIERVLKAQLPVYTPFYTIFLILFIPVSIYNCIKQKNITNKIFLILDAVLIIIIPFILSFVIGNMQMVRMNLVYGFVFAIITVLVFYTLKNKYTQIICVVLVVLAVFNNINICNRYEQKCHYIVQQDEILSAQLYDRMNSIRHVDIPTPLLVIGAIHPQAPGIYIDSCEAVGISFFEIDTGTKVASSRINMFMMAHGMKCDMPNDAQFAAAIEIAKELPIWPAEGSMVYNDGFYVVRISE